MVISQNMMHAGPLPTPETLAGYDDVVPGAGERVISMAEREQEHRHARENEELQIEGRRALTERDFVNGAQGSERRGQWMALLIVIALLGCTATLLAMDKTVEGTLFAAFGVTGLATAFIRGRQQESGRSDESTPT